MVTAALTKIPNVHKVSAVNLETLASMKASFYSLDQSHLFTASDQEFDVRPMPLVAD